MGKRKQLRELKYLRDKLQTHHDRVDSYLRNSPGILDHAHLTTLNEYRWLIIQKLNDILGDKSR